jgi:YesN/AraC family two-component response regulator
MMVNKGKRRDNMFKSLIVEDEKNIRDRLVQFFPWSEAGFHVIGSAENGEKAWEMIQSELPDVVLTDIMMPKMNGLELANKISEKYPKIKVVILSAFDDFSYAQQAISSNVKGYLLKPLLKKDFYEMMKKLADELQADKENKQKDIGMEERRVLSLLKGEQLNQKLMWEASYYRVIIFSFEREMVKVMSLSLRQSILDFVNNSWLRLQIPAIFYGDHLTLIITAEKPLSKINLLSKIESFSQALSERIQEIVEKNCTFVIGIGNMAKNVQAINKSYNEAVYALSYNYFNPNKEIFYFQDVINEQKPTTSYEMEESLQKTKNAIIESILNKQTKQLPVNIQHYFEIVPAVEGESVEKIRDISYEFVMLLFLKIKEKGFILPSVDQRQVLKKIHDLQSLNALQKWLEHVFVLAAEDMKKTERQHDNQYIQITMQYVEDNYAEKITLQGMADRLFIHQAYFSTIFKRETGKNFVDFVNKVRIEKAEVLISTTDYSMNEISSFVGFQSHSYFNKVFKRMTGVSPLHYRKNVTY